MRRSAYMDGCFGRGLGALAGGLEVLHGFKRTGDFYVPSQFPEFMASTAGIVVEPTTAPVTLATDPVAWADAQCQLGRRIFFEQAAGGLQHVIATADPSVLSVISGAGGGAYVELGCPGASPTPIEPSATPSVKTVLVVGGIGLLCAAGIYLLTRKKK